MSKNIRNEQLSTTINITNEAVGATGATGPQGIQGVAGSNVQIVMLNSVTNATDNNFIGYSHNTSTQFQATYIITRACTARNLYAISQNPASGGSFIFTLYNNGIPTLLTASITTGNSTGNNTSNSVSIPANTSISMHIANTGGPAVMSLSFELHY